VKIEVDYRYERGWTPADPKYLPTIQEKSASWCMRPGMAVFIKLRADGDLPSSVEWLTADHGLPNTIRARWVEGE